ncbi:M28 family peptidase [Mucilaginibacter panaciglaebae]|uniref:M20/M25/M40 family metallo-hydrolase n=1 Tax=Mucilaginibacter panaciglaebae TaxID=502331 RepID=A0ABP7WS10_9SPHI
MKNLIILSLLLTCGTVACAQDATVKEIAAINPPGTALAPLRYLASDELKGRGIDRPEINTAAQYIADQFKSFGVKTVPGANNYFQEFQLVTASPGKTGKATIGQLSFTLGKDFVQMTPVDAIIKFPLEYVGRVTEAGLNTIDVKGKIIMIDLGVADDDLSFRKDYGQLPALRALLTKKGAVALAARFMGKTLSWSGLSAHFNEPHLIQPDETTFLNTFIINNTPELQAILSKGYKTDAEFVVTGTMERSVNLKNVIGYIKGTDSQLKDQYVLLTSHYDHLGVGKAKMEDGKLDSIYNGARDNASGTTAVIDAARYFSKYPPARSMLFITYTAEEKGLIGSSYYASHPIVPLKQIIYNLNIDNASYDDTRLISLVGLGRTTADKHIKKACAAYGMTVNGDPTGGQLFFASDNYPLAKKGVPAPTFSFGMKTFGPEIFKRYHQLSDEVGNMDLNYMMKFIGAYILAAKYIADDPQPATWSTGDQLEKAGQELYGNK